ncbi:Hypothetical predicted protein [Octopus vulgaris]|uniref:Uncharacterized protein n=1 Tax=Octopus vulgaris TaxID=6645 RepID=A0AA36B657_OCTVU|nr:Hypothetical predicted protein [Octopus vulgaris]
MKLWPISSRCWVADYIDCVATPLYHPILILLIVAQDGCDRMNSRKWVMTESDLNRIFRHNIPAYVTCPPLMKKTSSIMSEALPYHRHLSGDDDGDDGGVARGAPVQTVD